MVDVNLPRVPEGLRDLVKAYTKDVLHEKPKNLYEFSVQYFENIAAQRMDKNVVKYEPQQTYQIIMKNRIRQQVPLSLAFQIIPENLTDVIKKFIKAVLKEKPQYLIIFAIEYFKNLQINSAQIENIKYAAYEKYIVENRMKSPTTKVTCECGRIFNSKEIGAQVKNTLSDANQQYTSLEINKMNQYSKAVYIIQKHFRQYLKRKTENSAKANSKTPDIYNKQEYLNAIILIQRQFRRLLLKNRANNTKLKNGNRESYNSVKYIKAALIIQRYIRQYLGKKAQQRSLPQFVDSTAGNKVSHTAAAFIIQRVFRRMVKARKAKPHTNPDLEQCDDINDNASEAASYTSASTALISSESAGEHNEFGNASYEEGVHQQTIKEDEEVENDNTNNKMECVTGSIKSSKKSINYNGKDISEPLLEDHGDENTNGQKEQQKNTITDAGDKTSKHQTEIDNDDITEYNVNVNEEAGDNIKTVQDDINIKESISNIRPQIDSLESIPESQAEVIIPSLKSPIGENNELVSKSIIAEGQKKNMQEEGNMKPISPTSTSILEPEKRLSPSDTNNTAAVFDQNAPLEATNGDYDKVDQNPPILTESTSAKCNDEIVVNANNLDISEPLSEDHGDENTNGQKEQQKDTKTDAGDKTTRLQTEKDNDDITEYNVNVNEEAGDNIKTVQDDINIKESISKISPQIDSLESIQESQAEVIIPSLKSPISENNELVSKSIIAEGPKKNMREEANMKPLSPTSTSILEPEKRLSPSDTNNTAAVCDQNAPLEATNSSRESADYDKVDQNPQILTATTSAKCNNESIVNANNIDISVHDNLIEPLLEDNGDENTNGQKDRQMVTKKDAGSKTSELQTEIHNDDITKYNVNVNEQTGDNIKTVQDDINIKESITIFSPQKDSLESMQESQAEVIIPSLKSPIGENNELVSKSIIAVGPEKNLREEANMKPLSPTSTSILEPEKRLSPSDTNNTAAVCDQNAPLEATNSSSLESADYDKVDQNPSILTATTSAKCNNENIVNANNLDINVHDNLTEPLLEDHGDENTNGQKEQQKDTITDAGDKTTKLQTEIDNDDITEYNVNLNEKAGDNIKTVQDDINIKESISKISPQKDSLESIQESQAEVIIPSLKSPISENNELVSKSIIAEGPKKNMREEANMKPLSPTSTSILEPEKRLSPSDTNNTAVVCDQNAPLEATNSSRESADYDKVDQNPSILTATTSAKCNNENIVNANNLDISVHDNLIEPLLEDHGDENTNGQKDRHKVTKRDAGDKTSERQTEIHNDDITEYNVSVNEEAGDNIKTVQDDINIKESISKISPQKDSLESIQESQAEVIIPSLKSPIGENNELVSKSIIAEGPKKNLREDANMKPLSTSILEPEKRLSPSDTNNTAAVCDQNAPLEATNGDYDKVDQNPPILTTTTSAKCNNENIVNANNLDISEPLSEDHGDANTNGQKEQQKDIKTDAGDKTTKLQTEIDNDDITEYNVNVNEEAGDNIKTVQDDINIKESISKISPQKDSLESIQESQAEVIIPSLKSPISENNELVSKSIIAVGPEKNLREEANMKPISPTSTSILEHEKRLSPSDTNNTAAVCDQNAPLEATNGDYDKVDQNPQILTATTSAKCNNENIVNANNLASNKIGEEMETRPLVIENQSSLPLSNQLIGTHINKSTTNTMKKKPTAKDKQLTIPTSSRLMNSPIAELQLKSFKTSEEGSWYTVYNAPNALNINTNEANQINSCGCKNNNLAFEEIHPFKEVERTASYIYGEQIKNNEPLKHQKSITFFISFDGNENKKTFKIPKKFLRKSESNITKKNNKDYHKNEVPQDEKRFDRSALSDLSYQELSTLKLQTIHELNEYEIGSDPRIDIGISVHKQPEKKDEEENKDNYPEAKFIAQNETICDSNELNSLKSKEKNQHKNPFASNIKQKKSAKIIERAYINYKARRMHVEVDTMNDSGNKKTALLRNEDLTTTDIYSKIEQNKILAATKIQKSFRRFLARTAQKTSESGYYTNQKYTNVGAATNQAKPEWFVGSQRILLLASEPATFEPIEATAASETASRIPESANSTFTELSNIGTQINGSLKLATDIGNIVNELYSTNVIQKDNGAYNNLAGSTNGDEFDLVKDLRVYLEAGPDSKETKLSSKEEPNSHVPVGQDNGSDELHEIEFVKKTDSHTNIYDDKADNETDTKKEYKLHPQNETPSSLDTLNSTTLKLSRTDKTIEKMSQRRSSETEESIEKEIFPITDAIYEKPSVQPMSSLQEQNSFDIEDGDIIVYNRLQREETRESSAQSESIVFGNADDDKALTNDVEITRSHLSRYYTIAGDDPHSIFKSGTIDDPVKYIDQGNEHGVNEPNISSSLCLDDETSENIRKKIMAYSLSEADSDYYDTNKIIKDDYHIDTAMTDVIDTSTETESTIVSTSAKIKPGARGILSRRRLRGASAGTKSSTQDTKASFGNDALSESLERFIEEEAAKKIQVAYRLHKKNPRKQTKGLESVSLENSLAAKRQTLQRGDALQNDSNSTPEDENTDITTVDHLPIIVRKNDGSNNEISSYKTSDMRVTWTALRQNSMPVQIDCEVLRIIPKHKRRRIKSAEAGKQKIRK